MAEIAGFVRFMKYATLKYFLPLVYPEIWTHDFHISMLIVAENGAEELKRLVPTDK